MIGTGLKKLAEENGLKVAHGVAYGNFRGYAVTLSEGSGYKKMDITTKFTDPEQIPSIQAELNAVNTQKEYGVSQLVCGAQGVSVVFLDTVGTLKKMAAFFDWFFPILSRYSATGANVCAACGGMLAENCWALVDGVALPLHSGCRQRIRENAEAENHEKKEGSYASGALGAVLGGLLGSILWAIVLSWGYVASIVGLVIGWLSGKGYDLLHGKQGKGKVVILAVAVILGVLLGTLISDGISLAGMIGSGELEGFTMGDIPGVILFSLANNSEYRAGTLANMAMGLVFAGLGVFFLLKNTGKAVSGRKVIDLQ